MHDAFGGMTSELYQSWGRWPRSGATAKVLRWRHQHLPIRNDQLTRVLPYGNGRSYGDVCLNNGGTLLDTRGLDKFIRLDQQNGSLACEAGVLFREVLELIIPSGWFLPVTPGTELVTVGGAIANDVHGKNHHRAGSFGCHVTSFELLRSDGSRLHCSPTQNRDLFFATIGGLGLTGVITWAEFRLMPIRSSDVVVETIPFVGVEEFLKLSAASESTHEYTVAWIDCVAKGAKFARGLFYRGNHSVVPAAKKTSPLPIGVPFTPPWSIVRPPVVRAFNACYFHLGKRKRKQQLQPYRTFFYPLDAVANWNRIYGRSGFLQYQFVVPPASSVGATSEILGRLTQSANASFLAVLKVFGERLSGGLLSFPRPGVTLAVDFPIKSPRLFEVLDELDDIVAAAGGAVYPAKDARMRSESFKAFFPKWPEFAGYIDPAFSSDFCRRVFQ